MKIKRLRYLLTPLLFLVGPLLMGSLTAKPHDSKNPTPAGTMFAPVAYTVQADPFPILTFGARRVYLDVDSDGDLDVLYQNGNVSGQGIALKLNDGSGGFATTFTANGSGQFSSGPLNGITFTQITNSSLFTLDYDNDGDTDLIETNNAAAGRVIRNNGDATFTLVADPFPVLTFGARRVYLDVDSDGDLDVLYQNGNTSGQGIALKLNDGSGGFATTFTASGSGQFSSGPLNGITFTQITNSSLFTLDYDNDGDTDLIETTNAAAGRVIRQEDHPPGLSSTVPADNATNVSPTTNLTLVFDRSVSKGTGNLLVVQTATNSITETIPVADARVTGSGTTWTVNPNTTLANSTAYAVRTGAGIFVDADGRIFRGIAKNTTFNFTTGVACPTITVTNPTVTTATQSTVFSQTCTALGGALPYSFSLASGSLPTGLTLSGAGVVAGITNQTGSFPITVQATDANGCGGTGTTYTLVVSAATPTITGLAATPNPVCAGSSVTFTATIGNVSGSYNYTLTNGNGPLTGNSTSAAFSQPVTASGSGTQSYTLTVSSNGQMTAATSSITVNALPIAGLTNNGPLTCAQTSVTLTASGGSSYSFSAGAIQIGTGNLAMVNASGTYSVTVANASGCTSTSTSTVISNIAAPTNLSLGNNGPLTCNQTSVTLTATATGATGYTLNTGASNTNGVFVVSTAGTYTVIAGNANGCTATATTTVATTTATPSVSILPTSATLTCASPTVSLTAVGSGSVRWDDNSTNALRPVNAAGTYSVTVTNTATGCFSTTSVSVSEDKTSPSASLVSSGTLSCAVTSLTLTAGTGTSYTFSVGATQIGRTNQAIVYTPGTYTVTVTGANGCTAMATAQVFSNTAAPSVSILPSSATLTCASPMVSLTASGNGSYVWDNNSTNAVRTVSTAGTYSVTVTGANGCTATAQTTVVGDQSVPTASLINDGPLTCLKTSVTLTAGGGATYRFSSGASQLNGGNTASVTTSGTYSVTVTSANGCTAIASTTVVGDQTPPPAGLINDGPLTCLKTSVTLTASGGTYRFSNGASQIGSTNQATVNTAGPYSVTLTSANGCTATATTTVTGDQIPPTASLSNNGPLSSTMGSVTLTAAPGGVAYAFSAGAAQQGGSSGNTATVTTPGIYSVTLTGTNGCTATAATSVTTTATPPGSQTVCRNTRQVLTTARPASRYEWYKNGQTAANKLIDVASIQVGTTTASLTLVSVQTSATYYVKEIQASGSFTWSGPFSVTVDGRCTARMGVEEPLLTLRVLVTPNPLEGDLLQATVEGAEGGPLTVQLVDLQGRTLYHQHWQEAEQKQAVSCSVSSQPAGVYLLQASTTTQRQTIKVVKP